MVTKPMPSSSLIASGVTGLRWVLGPIGASHMLRMGRGLLVVLHTLVLALLLEISVHWRGALPAKVPLRPLLVQIKCMGQRWLLVLVGLPPVVPVTLGI